MDGEEKLRGLT